MALTFGSLFAGIGGFDLGLERAGMVCKWQVENDPYATKVLEKHWPNVRRWDDVRTFPPVGEWGVDLICGGFPCQDISNAGRRVGIDGDRSGLWREYARIIRDFRPRFIIVENVSALLVRGMDRVLGDLAQIGYAAEWEIIPSSAFGAHFRGERVYIVASCPAASCLRRQGEWSNPSRAFAKNEFARLVERELSVCVPAGKDHRISDGLPARVDRLKCLGNSVMPQVAEWIGRRIVECEDR